MLSQISQNNLSKDKNVLGKNWLKTYNNYFSDEENIKHFADVVLSFLPKKKLNILYAASASGLLGEELIRHLDSAKLTLVDVSQKHLAENTNINTKKICCDLLDMDLGEKFDLIIMRSSLDYLPNREFQIQVLKNIKRHLEDGGTFINQPAYISDKKDRDIMSQIYNMTESIGNRFFQSSDLEDIYNEAGFHNFQKIGDGKDLILTDQEHVERYNISQEDILKIRDLIGVGSYNMRITESGYELRFEFPIFLAS